VRNIILVLAAAALLAACSGNSGNPIGATGPGGPAGAGGPNSAGGAPAQMELGALARAAMIDPEYATPRDVNALDLLNGENPNEFDDWFQP
jgi:hypothetical protein